ncbi:hypothetical protein H4S08_004622 [Coemansia sp. RSA 1365]|nr:hypothetical protein H4S08_004622 [Coemansia sp. RSA 1365]
MVRQYFRPKSQDASPFLGISECEPAVSDYEASKSNSPYIPKHTIQQHSDDTPDKFDTSYYSRVPVPPLPTRAHNLVQQHQKHPGTGTKYGSVAGRTMRLNVRIMPGMPDTNKGNTNQSTTKVTGKSRQRPETLHSHASSGAYSAASVFSPLVVDRPTNGLRRTSNNSVAANAESETLVVSLKVSDSTTIEELASAIEARVPWPFLPGWDYSPWVFDEILASVGFTLKKHTLLRFERSPVGLASLIQNSGINSAHYVRPLVFDMEVDPMTAIAEQFEPDINVVIWVNELQQSGDSGTLLLSNLGQLTVGFREQLLERITAQFVDEHNAHCLCDGYFRLELQLAPLQKQRKIRKTRKLRNFFGDNPHEALLRQQLMAVVPPSSHLNAARAAAELVARKRNAEARLRACDNVDRQESVSSSLIAEQKMLDSDCESDSDQKRRLQQQHLQGWVHDAMLRSSSSSPLLHPRVNSWSDSESSCNERSAHSKPVNQNGWTTDEDDLCGASADRRNAIHAAPADVQSSVYNDQTFNRALSMIGMSHADSQDSNSSDGGSPQMRPTRGRTGNGGRGLAAAAAADGSGGLPAVQCYSVYTAHAHSSASLGRAAGGLHGHGLGRGHRFTRFERKKRADKLRDFFGRMDHGPEDHHSSVMFGANGAHVDSADARSASVVSSIPSASLRSASFAPSDTPLTSEQRNILVRRRRKLKALLGEQVEESIINVSAPSAQHTRERRGDSTSEDIGSFSLSALDESAYSLLTPEYTSQTSSGTMSSTNPDEIVAGFTSVDEEQKARELHEAQVKQYSKIRDVLGDAAPAPSLYRNQSQQPSTTEDNADISHEQRLRARWRRNKLANMLGDLPSNIKTLYVTDNKLIPSSSDAPSDIDEHAFTEELTGHRNEDIQQQQRAKKLRHFFGQSLNSDAMLMQGISKMPKYYPENASTPAIISDTDQSFEFVEQPNASRSRSSGQWQLPSVSQSPVTDVIPEVLEHQHILPNNNARSSEDGLITPVGAQFWMTSSPESQESVITADENSGNRNSFLASLRARKASIIGSIKRSSPSSTSSAPKQVLAATAASPRLPTRSRTSTLSSYTSRAASSVRDLNGKRHSSHSLTSSHITGSPGKRSFLSRKSNRANGSPALSTKSPVSLTKAKLWGSSGDELHASQKPSPLIPPTRLSSIKPLSPLPAISPNNLQASFDRGVALREVVAVADYISGGVTQFNQRKSQFNAGVIQRNQTDFPPRISSAEDRYDHRQVISSVLMSSSMRGTRSRTSSHPHKQQQQQLPPLPAIESQNLPHLNESKNSAHGKSVHWFDSLEENPRKSAERDRWHNPKPIRQTRVSLDEVSPPASAKSSMELSMSIVLRSPLPKNPSIKSPTLSPRMSACSPPRTCISQLPIASPPPAPRMSLSHKASISAVGGRQIATSSGVVKARRPTLDINSRFFATANSRSTQSTEPAHSSVVTIRGCRSQSFVIYRNLERATLGRKRANTIDTGRQAESRRPTQTKDADSADSILLVDKNTRRVQSMIISARRASEINTGRERCATVIPLHLELECLLARRLAVAAQARGSLATISESEELLVAKPGITDSNLPTLRRTADALYIDRLQSKAISAFPITSGKSMRLQSSGNICTAFTPQQQPRRGSCQLVQKLQNLSANAALGIPVPYGRHRSRSCAGRFMTSRKRTPIQPAVTRYLQSVNAGHSRYGHTSMARRNSYQRISMALLSRPLSHLNGAYGRSNGRRSLDSRSTHRKLSPYMESSLRHFSSMGNDNLRRPAANVNNENHI